MSKGQQKQRCEVLLMSICALGIFGILSSCGGGSSEVVEPPPPKIAGIWSGSWNGEDPTLGPISGTWEAQLSQNDTVVHGPISFGGDIDCAEGKLDGITDSDTRSVTGAVTRGTCPAVNWQFTAFDDVEFVASGSWDKQGLTMGFFEGKRVATISGPYVKYIHPPAAQAFDYVTIVGERLDMDPINDSLTLGEGGIALIPDTVSDTVITLQLPGNVADSDNIVLTTSNGEATSPKSLSLGVTSPNTSTIKNIVLDTPGTNPSGIVVSANGRRAFVANRSAGSVSMINVERELEQTSTVVLPGTAPPVPIHAVALDPAGRKVYAAGDGVVAVLHAQTDQLIHTLVIPAHGSTQPNPQGIAVSPDGRWLLVSEAIDGGRVTVIDVDNNYTVANTLVMATGNTPRGIATSPDNRHAYIAVSGSDNEIWAYEFATATVDEKIVMGASPTAIAVTPGADWLYFANSPSTTIHYYELDTGGSGEVDLGPGVTPNALAITPDGQNVFVASNTNSVQIINTVTKGVTWVDVGGPSSSIAIGPFGKRAFATVPSLDKVVEISNQVVVRVSKKGGGIGTVTSVPEGINCGTTCIASFDAGTEVQLVYDMDSASDSSFDSWGGETCSGPACKFLVTLGLFPIVFFNAIAGDCFIATAAYGSWLDPHVVTLRRFRDEHMLTNEIGRWFADLYYRYSPPMADYIRERENLKAVVRVILSMIIFAIKYPIMAGLLVLLPMPIVICRRRRRLRFAHQVNREE